MNCQFADVFQHSYFLIKYQHNINAYTKLQKNLCQKEWRQETHFLKQAHQV
jgi:hypothetical protein